MGQAEQEKPTACAERQRLGERFADATQAFAEAVVQLAKYRGTTSEIDCSKLRAVAEARRNSEFAGSALEQHIANHRC